MISSFGRNIFGKATSQNSSVKMMITPMAHPTPIRTGVEKPRYESATQISLDLSTVH